MDRIKKYPVLEHTYRLAKKVILPSKEKSIYEEGVNKAWELYMLAGLLPFAYNTYNEGGVWGGLKKYWNEIAYIPERLSHLKDVLEASAVTCLKTGGVGLLYLGAEVSAAIINIEANFQDGWDILRNIGYFTTYLLAVSTVFMPVSLAIKEIGDLIYGTGKTSVSLIANKIKHIRTKSKKDENQKES